VGGPKTEEKEEGCVCVLKHEASVTGLEERKREQESDTARTDTDRQTVGNRTAFLPERACPWFEDSPE